MVSEKDELAQENEYLNDNVASLEKERDEKDAKIDD